MAFATHDAANAWVAPDAAAARPAYPTRRPHPARMDSCHSAQIGGLPDRLASVEPVPQAVVAACGPGLGVAVARRIGRCTIPECCSVLAVNRELIRTDSGYRALLARWARTLRWRHHSTRMIHVN